MDMQMLYDVSVRLLMAAGMGGVVGFERELHGRWAGLRTHMLVAMGAAIFTIAGLEVSQGTAAEVSRVIQGVAAGVGFLGAGTILKLSTALEVKGLTTAASVWVAAALGTACGLGMTELAIAALVVTLVVLVLLRPVDKWFGRAGKKDD